MKDIGVIIGHFQVLRLTSEQENFYKLVRHRHQEAWVVLVDDPVKGSTRHPFSVEVRQSMIKEVFSDAVVLSLKESPEPADWSQRLEKLLQDKDSQAEFILYGTPSVLGNRYTGNWKTEEIDDDLDSDNPEAAEGFNPEVVTGEAFRKGIIYAFRQLYPQVYPTVDIAIYRESDSKWLLVRKGYNKEWRFPGGFSDPDDKSFEKAAARELKEETGVTTGNLTYEMSLRVNDWRYRDEKDKIITTLFSGKWLEGEAKASDDIAEVRWTSAAEVQELMNENQVADEHRPLFVHLLNK